MITWTYSPRLILLVFPRMGPAWRRHLIVILSLLLTKMFASPLAVSPLALLTSYFDIIHKDAFEVFCH